MDPHELAANWQLQGDQAFSQMQQWRLEHPHATLAEIEAATDQILAQLRRRMIQDSAHADPLNDWVQLPTAQRPRCPQCNKPLKSRGRRKRQLQTDNGQQLQFERGYGTCPQCAEGFFPPR